MALVNYASSEEESTNSESELPPSDIVQNTGFVSTSTDKVEPEYKMRMPKSAKQSSSLPSFTSLKSKTGKILVTLPVLEGLDSSSSESDTEVLNTNVTNKQRSRKPATHSSVEQAKGLLSLLPPVRSSAIRDGPKPTLMVPHQVAVKRAPPPGQLVKPSLSATPQSYVDAEDDWNIAGVDDDESNEDVSGTSSNFFSFLQSPREDPQAVAGARAAATTRVLQSLVLPSSQHEASNEPDSVNVPAESIKPTTTPRFTPRLCSIDPSVLSGIDVPKNSSPSNDDKSDDVPVEPQYWTDYTFVPGPERKRARINQPNVKSLPVVDLLSTSNQIIREVNQADLTAGADVELIKSVTSDESQYVSRSSDDDPGKLAHRKHQITWLAHQAQENELELEKRWAEARRNKATSRAKYGF